MITISLSLRYQIKINYRFCKSHLIRIINSSYQKNFCLILPQIFSILKCKAFSSNRTVPQAHRIKWGDINLEILKATAIKIKIWMVFSKIKMSEMGFRISSKSTNLAYHTAWQSNNYLAKDSCYDRFYTKSVILLHNFIIPNYFFIF